MTGNVNVCQKHGFVKPCITCTVQANEAEDGVAGDENGFVYCLHGRRRDTFCVECNDDAMRKAAAELRYESEKYDPTPTPFLDAIKEHVNAAQVIRDREPVHGDFDRRSEFSQGIKDTMRVAPNWDRLSAPQVEALEMIAVKISRILHGDPHKHDSWLDIAGYAQLVADTIAAKPDPDQLVLPTFAK